MATQGSTKDEPWKIDMLLGYKFSTIYFFSQAPIEFKQCSNVKFYRIQIIMAKICLHMHTHIFGNKHERSITFIYLWEKLTFNLSIVVNA